MRQIKSWIVGLLIAAVLLGLGGLIVKRLLSDDHAGRSGRGVGGPAPVAVAEVQVGTIENRRVFSGTLEANAQLMIAPKVAGRIVRLPVDLADTVERDQVVAEMDSDEFVQAVAQAEAELAVARANLTEAENAVEIAQREWERAKTLSERGVASEAQLDTARSEQLARSAAVEVAKAQVTRAEAALQSARIRLGYTTITASWSGGDNQRVVAQRIAEEGQTVAANTPLLSIVELDPIRAVVFVTEREYALLAAGQAVSLRTDAYPDREWEGRVSRVSPVFREGSRQARVELNVPNEGGLLKPGMFVRVEAELGRADDATIIPVEALVTRQGRSVIFLVNEAGDAVRMVPVETGIVAGDRVQVMGEGVRGRVVVLGQQLVSDGSAITIPDLSNGIDTDSQTLSAGGDA